jgi:hypothetical protein
MSVSRAIRRATPLIGAVALVAIGLAVGAEVTGLMDGHWRQVVADTIAAVFFPGWAAWQSALAGAGLAIVAMILIAAELTRPAKGIRIMYPVHDTSTGNTHITGKAAIRAAERHLDDIEGIVDTDASITKNTMNLTVRVDDRADLGAVEAQIRDRLDHEFWINLGLADFATNLLITHHPKPPRVR